MLERTPIIEVVTEEPEQFVLMLPERVQTQPDFGALWAGASEAADDALRVLWERLRDAWLRAKESKSTSRHTRRAYEAATMEWFEYLTTLRHADGRPVRPWEATAEHVRNWQEEMIAQRSLAPASANQRLAACSSYYSFVIAERGLVNGFEVTGFMDAGGRTRANPFTGANVPRARVKRYGKAKALKPGDSSKLMTYLEAHNQTMLGARNHALLLTYLMTGYRNHEVVSMRWGDIRANSKQPGAWVITWRGKGAKEENDPLPARVYHAIVHYLKASGRFPADLKPEDFVFIPHVTQNMKNLKNFKEGGEGHLSEKSAQRILHTALRAVGLPPIRVHDLRHTFAHGFRRTNGDMEALRGRLHHESLATTGIYAREFVDEPIDDYSESLYQTMFQFSGEN